MAQPQVLTMSPGRYHKKSITSSFQRWLHKVPDHERNSIASCFWAFCTHFGERNENEDTIEFFDGLVLMKSAEGKAVIQIWDVDALK